MCSPAAANECGVPAAKIIQIAREIAARERVCGARVAQRRGGESRRLAGLSLPDAHFGAGRRGGTPGGTNPNTRDKFVPPPFLKPPPQNVWSELLYPREYPLAYHELSYLLPHLLLDGRGKISAYFTRVYNPVWTNPDGMMWEKVLRDEKLIGVHAAITPVWSETAQYADYVLPTGLGAERHDLMSQETHAAQWISFRQPVLRTARERLGERVRMDTRGQPRSGVGRGRVLDRALRGGSILTARSESASTSNRRTARDSASRWTSTTGGSSRSPCPAFPPRRPSRRCRRWSTCAASGRFW
jgi:anaerobic selenocysteine-containing dehydrogenase